MFPIRDHNPSSRVPFVTYALIALNVVIFLGTLGISQNDASLWAHYQDWAMIPARISAGDGYYTLISSMFLHGGFMHLAGNMLFLWIFGDNLEDQMGHVGFLIFYLATGIAASLAQYALDPGSMVPVVGASGAIAGVMGGYLLLFPKAKVDVLLIFIVFFRVFSVPAWVMLGVWFGLQLFNSAAPSAGGGVAYWAHSGGFIAGFLLALPLWMKRGAAAYWRRNEGHPPHAEAKYPVTRTSIPTVRRRR